MSATEIPRESSSDLSDGLEVPENGMTRMTTDEFRAMRQQAQATEELAETKKTIADQAKAEAKAQADPEADGKKEVPQPHSARAAIAYAKEKTEELIANSPVKARAEAAVTYAKEKVQKTEEFIANSPVKAKVEAAVIHAKEKTEEKTEELKAKAEAAMTFAKEKKEEFVVKVKTTEVPTAKDVHEFATTTRTGMTLTLAVVGSVLGCGAGAFFGALCGLLIGLLLGIFTFGISIPVGTIMGLAVGGALGAAIGGVLGAIIGYGGFTYRKEIRDLVQEVHSRFESSAKFIQNKVQNSAAQVRESVKSFAGTGGTEGKEKEA